MTTENAPASMHRTTEGLGIWDTEERWRVDVNDDELGCHWAAMSGWRAARELVTESFRPLQHGQPVPRLVRLSTRASHSWSEPSGHCHQYFPLDPATTWSAVTAPFLVGCHWAAMSGWRAARELVTEVFKPLQNEQPVPLVRLLTVASHSWSGPSRHFHQYRLLEPARTCTGVTLPFLAGCHWAAMSGWRAARELVTDTFKPLQ